MLLSRLSSASLASATRIAARSVLPQRTLFTTQHRTLRAAIVSTWPVVQPRNIAAPKLYRSLFASSVRRMTSSSSDTTGDGDDDNGATSHTQHANKADGDDASAQDHSDQVQVTINTSLHDAKRNHRWKYHRPYTPGDLRSAAENDTPVYFMITPPNEPGYLTDVYVDTTTLEWAYQPPVPVIAAQTPEHMNLSTVLVLYHPGASQQQTSSQTAQGAGPPAHLAGSGHTFVHDYYMFTSYVMPAAQLVISDYKDPNDHHNVTFKVTTTPAAIYYEYNSYSQRYALYEVRHGQNGPERIYLIPVLLPDEGQHNRKVVKGVGVDTGVPVPESYYTFMGFKADITIYVPDLPTI